MWQTDQSMILNAGFWDRKNTMAFISIMIKVSKCQTKIMEFTFILNGPDECKQNKYLVGQKGLFQDQSLGGWSGNNKKNVICINRKMLGNNRKYYEFMFITINNK